MTARLNIRIDRGGMPRSGILNKKFDLLLDEKKIGALGWGEKRSFHIPAGNHKLTLFHRRLKISYCLDINTEEGGTVDIDSFMNMKGGGLTIFNRADGTSSALPGSGSTSSEELVKIRKAASEELILGACASAGAILFVILNFVTGGLIPGGFLGGFLGAALGAALGAGINTLRRK